MICYAGYHYDSTAKSCTQCTGNTFTNQATNVEDWGYGTTKACDPCGTNSTADEESHAFCKCDNGYHKDGEKNTVTTTGKTKCVLNKYTITYMSGNGSTQTQEITHGESVTLLDESTFTKTGYKLSNWVQEKSSTTYAPGATISNGFTSNITLTAKWTPKEFKVTYDVDGATNCGLTSQDCTYDQSGCTAPYVNNCTKPGHTFMSWSCTSGCNSGGGTIGMGKNISTLSDGNEMTLTANWQECFIGHYCPGIYTNPIPCPAGSTSAALSTDITDCYMTKDTEIYDINNKKFTLPDGVGNIYYHGK